MAVLEVLTEVVGAVELLGRVALAELVNLLKVANAFVPILVGRALRQNASTQGAGARGDTCASKLVAAVATDVSLAGSVSGFVEGSVVP